MPSSVDVNVVHHAPIDDLLHSSSKFAFLSNSDIHWSKKNLWQIRSLSSIIRNIDVYFLQIMFIGKTGYGKSTTLNKICGKELFITDDINSCTKSIFSALYKMYRVNKYPFTSEDYYLSLCDLPGIGESQDTNNIYMKLYSKMIKKSACVVYILRADQRDFSLDKIVINSLLTKHKKLSEKLIIGINFADKIEPITRSSPFTPNSKQAVNLENKVLLTASSLNIQPNRIVSYSATEGYNFDELLGKICMILKQCVK